MRDALGLVKQTSGYGYRRDLAARHLLTLCHRLPIHERKDRHVTQGVDCVHQVGANPDQTAPRRNEPSLALDRGSCFQVRPHQGRGKPAGSRILV